jgi:hypothetical protein
VAGEIEKTDLLFCRERGRKITAHLIAIRLRKSDQDAQT